MDGFGCTRSGLLYCFLPPRMLRRVITAVWVKAVLQILAKFTECSLVLVIQSRVEFINSGIGEFPPLICHGAAP